MKIEELLPNFDAPVCWQASRAPRRLAFLNRLINLLVWQPPKLTPLYPTLKHEYIHVIYENGFIIYFVF